MNHSKSPNPKNLPSDAAVAVIPAWDEEAHIGQVVEVSLGTVGIDAVLVADNGSSDATSQRAKAAGAEVFYEPNRGYGHACLRAVESLQRPAWLVFVDGDNSVYGEDIARVLTTVRQAGPNALVVGARRGARLHPQAMSLPQRFGNSLASLLILILWQRRVSDLGPLRAIHSTALKQLDMQEMTFGWTVEMQLKALHRRMDYREVTVGCRPRIGPSKISGTIGGVIRAGYGIIGTLLKLRWRFWWQSLRAAIAKKQKYGLAPNDAWVKRKRARPDG